MVPALPMAQLLAEPSLPNASPSWDIDNDIRVTKINLLYLINEKLPLTYSFIYKKLTINPALLRLFRKYRVKYVFNRILRINGFVYLINKQPVILFHSLVHM